MTTKKPKPAQAKAAPPKPKAKTPAKKKPDAVNKPPKATPKPRRQPPKTPLMLDGKHWDKPKVMAIICARIASSSKSLMRVLAEPHEGYPLPSMMALMEWLGADTKIAEQYARAKSEQADFMGEEFLELHEKAWIPVLIDDKPVMVGGKPLMTVSPASSSAVKLEADNKKWLMGKLRPKKYGERVEQHHTGTIGFGEILSELDGQSTGLPR